MGWVGSGPREGGNEHHRRITSRGIRMVRVAYPDKGMPSLCTVVLPAWAEASAILAGLFCPLFCDLYGPGTWVTLKSLLSRAVLQIDGGQLLTAIEHIKLVISSGWAKGHIASLEFLANVD